MAINFSSLPIDKPNSIPDMGTYYATIDAAEMKQGLDKTKPQYLSITLSLKDKDGKACGKIFDNLFESDKQFVQYKLARFITALGLENLGTFELHDLVKLIKGKQLIVDVKHEESDRYGTKAVVDPFNGSIYYPMREASEIFGTALVKPSTKVEAPKDVLTIDASDAADVHAADDDDF